MNEIEDLKNSYPNKATMVLEICNKLKLPYLYSMYGMNLPQLVLLYEKIVKVS